MRLMRLKPYERLGFDDPKSPDFFVELENHPFLADKEVENLDEKEEVKTQEQQEQDSLENRLNLNQTRDRNFTN